jgi:hypothetical protein
MMKKLTGKQRSFVRYYLECMNHTQAAQAAGCPKHSAEKMGYQWLHLPKYAHVQMIVAEGLREIELRSQMKAADVLQYAHSNLQVEWGQYFHTGTDGWWCSEEELRSLPHAVHRLIERVEHKYISRTLPDGTIETIKQVIVYPVSKAKSLEIAARYQLGDRINVAIAKLPDNFWENAKTGTEIVEGKMRQALEHKPLENQQP